MPDSEHCCARWKKSQPEHPGRGLSNRLEAAINQGGQIAQVFGLGGPGHFKQQLALVSDPVSAATHWNVSVFYPATGDRLDSVNFFARNSKYSSIPFPVLAETLMTGIPGRTA
jgi:hypothetical protein